MQGSQGSPMAGYNTDANGNTTTQSVARPDSDAGQLRTMLQRNTGDGTFGRSSTYQVQAVVGGNGSPVIIGGRYGNYYPYGYGYNGYWGYGYRRGYQTSTPVVPVSVPVTYGTTQPQAAPPPPPEPTPIEKAWLNLRDDNAGRAVTSFEKLIEEDPEAFELVRALGFSLLVDGKMDEGIATIRMAYVRDPDLASDVMDEAVDLLGPAEFRKLLREVVRHAHDRDTASAWLAVAVLMQAEGRERPAMRMIDRAEGFSLDDEIVTSFERVLNG